VDLREIEFCRCAVDSSGSGSGPVSGFFEHGDEPFGSIKGGKFLDH
jgi:hypothetical protein